MYQDWRQAVSVCFQSEVYFFQGWKKALTLPEVKNRIDNFVDESQEYFKKHIPDQQERSEAFGHAQDLLGAVYQWKKEEEDGDQTLRLERERDLNKNHFDGYFPEGWESVDPRELRHRLDQFKEYGKTWRDTFTDAPKCKKEAESFLALLTKVVDDHLL
jgi:hypothetical protein